MYIVAGQKSGAVGVPGAGCVAVLPCRAAPSTAPRKFGTGFMGTWLNGYLALKGCTINGCT